MQPTDWTEYEGVAIRHLGGDGAYIYRTSHVALDADGSPRAYHPDDIGIDANANAGYPHKGWLRWSAFPGQGGPFYKWAIHLWS